MLKSANPFKGGERRKETARLNEFAARALPLIREALDDRLAFGAARGALDKACGEAAIKIGRDSTNEDAAGAMIGGCISGVDFPDGEVALFATGVVEGVFVTFREMGVTVTPETVGKLARTSTSALRGELDTSPDVRAGALAIAAQSFLPAQASQSLPTGELEKVIAAAAQNMVGCILSWEPPKEEIPEITSIGTATAMHVIAGTLAISDG